MSTASNQVSSSFGNNYLASVGLNVFNTSESAMNLPPGTSVTIPYITPGILSDTTNFTISAGVVTILQQGMYAFTATVYVSSSPATGAIDYLMSIDQRNTAMPTSMGFFRLAISSDRISPASNTTTRPITVCGVSYCQVGTTVQSMLYNTDPASSLLISPSVNANFVIQRVA